MTREMRPLRDWRATPLTIGLLVALVVGGGTLAAFIVRAGGEMREVAKRQVDQHQDRDVDRAHSDLPSKYVPRTEVSDRLNAIQVELRTLKTMQETILREVRDRRRRRR